jgi:hypothetical protein
MHGVHNTVEDIFKITYYKENFDLNKKIYDKYSRNSKFKVLFVHLQKELENE